MAACGPATCSNGSVTLPLPRPCPSPLCLAPLALDPLQVLQPFLAQLKQRAESINIGDPLEKGCRMGPLVNKDQYSKVLGYVQVSNFAQRECRIAISPERV